MSTITIDYWVVRIYPWDTSGDAAEWAFQNFGEAQLFAEHCSKRAVDNEHWYAGSNDPNATIQPIPQHFSTLEKAIEEAEGMLPEVEDNEDGYAEEDDDDDA